MPAHNRVSERFYAFVNEESVIGGLARRHWSFCMDERTADSQSSFCPRPNLHLLHIQHSLSMLVRKRIRPCVPSALLVPTDGKWIVT